MDRLVFQEANRGRYAVHECFVDAFVHFHDTRHVPTSSAALGNRVCICLAPLSFYILLKVADTFAWGPRDANDIVGWKIWFALLRRSLRHMPLRLA